MRRNEILACFITLGTQWLGGVGQTMHQSQLRLPLIQRSVSLQALRIQNDLRRGNGARGQLTREEVQWLFNGCLHGHRNRRGC